MIDLLARVRGQRFRQWAPTLLLEGDTMGYPLRSNIFRRGTNEQRELARFPVQAAVLFSANRHKEFANALQELFSHLDRLTADDVVFFAVLDPPNEWLGTDHGREWVNRYGRTSSTAFGVDDDVLVREVARTFAVEWDDLPVLVASPNLWLGEYCCVPTDSRRIESQFRTLVDLVREIGRPTLELIRDTFEAECAVPVRVLKPRDWLRDRMTAAYRFQEVSAAGDLPALKRAVSDTIRDTQEAVARVRGQFTPFGREDDWLPDDTLAEFGSIAEDAAGRLVIPATFAAALGQRLREPTHLPAMESLDSESQVLIDTALRVGHMLEAGNHRGTDFTAAAVSAWKVLEREANLSVVQAARASRGVPMPDRFAKYDPDLTPPHLGQVRTGTDRMGRPVVVFINSEDRERRDTDQRHRFVELGKSLHLCQTLAADRQARFGHVIHDALGVGLSPSAITAWGEVVRIRNRGSHTDLISRSDYERVLHCVLGGDILPAFTKLKLYLLNQVMPRTPPPRSVQWMPRPSLKYKDRVQATLVSDPKGRQRPWAAVGECSGPVLPGGTRPSALVGDTVELIVHAVHSDRVDFCWPDDPRLRHG